MDGFAVQTCAYYVVRKISFLLQTIHNLIEILQFINTLKMKNQSKKSVARQSEKSQPNKLK